MNAGLLTDVIKIYQSDYTVTDYHSQEITYTLKYTTRANVRQISGSRADENNETMYNYGKEFIVRHYVPITDYDIIEWKDNKYRILNIDETNKTDLMQIKIQAELINE